MKIKDIGKVITGKTPKTKNIENFEGAINFITPEDIAKGYIVKATNRHISEKGFESIKSNTLNGISVLVGCIGSDIGNVAVSEGKCASNQQINAITEIADIWNPFYIYYYLSTKKQYFRQIAGTTTTPILPKSVFEEINIPYVEKNLQDRIADILKALDNKIENSNKINEELESMVKTIYDYWFLQFEFPNEDGKPYKSSGGKMVWNEELQREIPEGWKIETLGNLFTSNRGISYNSKTIEGDGVPMINLASFNVNGSYKEEGIKVFSGEYSQDKVIKPFDLVICNTQQTAIDYKKDIIGRAFLVPDIFEGDIVTSHHVTTIHVKKGNMKYFLYRFFNTDYFHKYVTGFTNGTNILGLIFDGIEKYRLEIPSDYILDKFAELMLDIEMKKSRIIKENQELASLRNFLLPLLMNGQVGFED